jgi:AbrB family looped-hinge helix DNA binding protein
VAITTLAPMPYSEYNVVIEVISMTTAAVSEKGQITLPIEIRRKLGLEPRSRVEFEFRGGEVILRRQMTVRELEGIFAHQPIPGMTLERETEMMEEAVAREVVGD